MARIDKGDPMTSTFRVDVADDFPENNQAHRQGPSHTSPSPGPRLRERDLSSGRPTSSLSTRPTRAVADQSWDRAYADPSANAAS